MIGVAVDFQMVACPACGEVVGRENNVVSTTACIYLDCPTCESVSLVGRRAGPLDRG